MISERKSFFAKRQRLVPGHAVFSLNNERVGLVVKGPSGGFAAERPAGNHAGVTLAKLVQEAGAADMSAEWLLEPGQYQMLPVEKPAVPASEWVSALRWKARDMLPFPIEEAVLDAFEVPGSDSHGRPASLYLAAARKDELRPRIAEIATAGLVLKNIGIADLAWAAVARQVIPGDDSLAVLVLDPRGGSMLALREQRLFVSRRFEFDSDNQRALRDRHEPLVERLFERVVLELQRTLDYFDRNHQRPPPRRLLLVSGVDGAEGLEGNLRRLLGIEVQALDAATHWPVLSAQTGAMRSRLAALAATASGAAA